LEPLRSTNDWHTAGAANQDLDFGEIKDQHHVKRAVEVAAAGGHNILTIKLSNSQRGLKDQLSDSRSGSRQILELHGRYFDVNVYSVHQRLDLGPRQIGLAVR
jgi:hypothetical protein